MSSHLETQADLERAIAKLVKQDPRLRPILAATGIPTLRRRDPGFAGLAQIVVGQQLSTASANAIWNRMSKAFDPFHHDSIRGATAARLGRLGLSAAKIKTLKLLAAEIRAKRLDLEALGELDADEAHKILTALHGVGPWTADVYLLFCLGHADAWPAGDLALQDAVRLVSRCRGAPVVGVLSRSPQLNENRLSYPRTRSADTAHAQRSAQRGRW